ETSLAILKELVADFSSRRRYKKKLATALNSQGNTLARTGNLEGAEQCSRQARDLLEPLLSQVHDPSDYRAVLGIALGNLGYVRARQEKWDEARRLLEPALDHLQAGLSPEQARQDYREALRSNAQTLAETLVRLGDHAAAVKAADTLAGVFPEQPL